MNDALMTADRSRRRVVLARAGLLVACVLAVSGCSTVKGWFGGKGSDAKKANEPAELTKFTETAKVSKLWSVSVGKGEKRLGVRQTPTIADGRVYAAAVKGGVRALDLQTGKVIWTHETDVQISGGPGVGDGLVAAGGLEGEVVALDAATGAEKWKAKVNNEVIAAPAIGQGVVVVRSNDGRVTAFDAATGERKWFWNHELPPLTVRGNDAPTLAPGFVFVGNDDGTVAALSITDGRPVWDQTVAQPDGRSELERMADVDGSPVIDGVTLYASSFKKQTIALDGPTGRVAWNSDHGGSGRVGVGSDRVVVADPAGTVWALDKTSGSALWSQPVLARRNLSSAVVQGSYAVVGDLEGYLHWLRLDNGELAARVRTGKDPVRGSPVVADGILVAEDTDGGLSAYRVE